MTLNLLPPKPIATRRLLLGSLGVAFVWLLVNFSLGWKWIDQPFTGFLHQNRVVTRSSMPGWETHETANNQTWLNQGDVIVAVDGQRLGSSEQLLNYVRHLEPGHPITYELFNQAEQQVRVTLPVARFTGQDFTQIVIIPAFIAVLALLTSAIAIHLQVEPLPANLFALFTLAMVFAWGSLPDLSTGNLSTLNFILALTGQVVLPPLLVHFTLVFPQPRKLWQNSPALLPLLYLPILPALVCLPTLLNRPETVAPFYWFVNGYTFIYAAAGFGLLLEAALRATLPLVRKQTVILLIGLIFPAVLTISLDLLLDFWLNRRLIFDALEQYGLVGLPIAVAIAAIRYELFGIKQHPYWHTLYAWAIGGVLAGYFSLLTLINTNAIHLIFIGVEDWAIILTTTLAFLLLRPLYDRVNRRLEQHLYGNVEDFKISQRIFLQELLKIKDWPNLEQLVSWNIPTDFKLNSAELTTGSLPRGPYSLQLPLTVNNIFLGTLFLGAKINGRDFTQFERAILADLQRSIALAVWSLELDRAIHITEELTRLKSKFLANVTHELRTPLNSIINYIGFVVDGDTGPLNPEQQSYLNQALQGAERLLHTINNILDMSRIEAGQMTLQIRSFNLADLLVEILPRTEEALTGKPVQLIVDLSPALPDISGDRLRLRHVFLSLLSNAAKFTDAGFVRLTAYSDNGHIVIQIADTGQGIKETMLPTVFQQFTREGLADLEEHGGVGLSLAIAKYLVEMHKGHITVESQEGQGTTFTITLPLDHSN